MDARNRVLNMLLDAEKGAFSGELFRQLRKEAWDGRDMVFITRLFYGTLEKQIWLDFVINAFAGLKTEKMKPAIRNILRMSLYQMKFMDSVPDRAAIDEGVKLTRKRGFDRLSSFVNGILRAIQREELPEMPDYVRHSVPKWIYDKLTEDYGNEYAENYLTAIDNRDSRITIAAMSQDVAERLEKEGCSVDAVDRDALCYRLSGFESITELKAYRDGCFYVQDVNSVRVALEGLRAVRNPSLIVDVCAAPGGKSIIAAREFPKARIISRDVSEEKVNLIRENAERLKLKGIEAEVYDALQPDESLAGSADLVIADLPCSGLGVMGRKPDIKQRVRKEDIAQLTLLQREILKVAATYLKKGGVLAYSTCTFCREENLENAMWAEENLGLAMSGYRLFSPEEGDCLFVAVFRK